MKKYSVFTGGECLAKYGIKSILCIINNRAKRRLFSDGRIEFPDTASTAAGERAYYMQTMTTVKAIPDEYRVVHNEQNKTVCISVPVLNVQAIDESIEVKEVLVPILTIGNNSYAVTVYTGDKLNTEQWHKCLEICYPKLISGPVDKTAVDLAYRLISLWDEKFADRSHASIMNFICREIENLPFFSDDKCLEYKSLFQYLSESIISDIFKEAISGGGLNTEEDLLNAIYVPVTFKQVVKENPDFLYGNYGWCSKDSNLAFKHIQDYPLEVQNVLAYYALHGKLKNHDVKAFLKLFSVKDMDIITLAILQRFIIRDLGKGFTFENLWELYTYLQNNDIPVTNRTLCMKFSSSLVNRSWWEEQGNPPEVMDVFEELLEKDALSAVKYLRANAAEPI